mmetsp:Transcript_79307/g.214541  ORF Transcript_79307/g.214541 Transcript_79307/m.214541 type:complete len:96 (+) Transcript_79307:619-906(+)
MRAARRVSASAEVVAGSVQQQRQRQPRLQLRQQLRQQHPSSERNTIQVGLIATSQGQVERCKTEAGGGPPTRARRARGRRSGPQLRIALDAANWQ